MWRLREHILKNSSWYQHIPPHMSPCTAHHPESVGPMCGLPQDAETPKQGGLVSPFHVESLILAALGPVG